MTPKEKAIYLYTMFKQRTHYIEVLYTPELLDKFHNNAISCALIAVDEILDVLNGEDFSRNAILFWSSVKQEIEIL